VSAVVALIERAVRLGAWAGRALVLTSITYFIILLGYVACRSHPFFEPRELSLTALDRAVPFWVDTVWIYGTVSWVTLLGYFLVRDARTTGRFGLTLLLASAACWLGFALHPVSFPRHLYPLEGAGGALASIARLAELRESDAPDNCLPSLHVALATSLALLLREPERPRLVRALAPVWAVLVSLSTLTVKQHYVVDVLGGAVVGLAAWALARRAARGRPYWQTAEAPLALETDDDRAFVEGLLRKVEAHQWSLDELELPAPARPFEAPMVRLLNHVIYIEEIAARNFRFLKQAARDESVRRLYQLFEDEEVRHAEGLRRVLLAGGGKLERPGLGNGLVLAQQTELDPSSDADVVLVTLSNPVFETFLDAGTIPFLRAHPALRSAGFDALVSRIGRDEAAHIALNWFFSRKIGRSHAHVRHLFNPSIARGMVAIPFMSLDVYALAHRLGYDFATLLPSFRKLWSNHKRFPELMRLPMWRVFRLFVLCGLVSTWVTLVLARLHLLFVRFWTTFSRLTDYLAWALFGRRLLEVHALPQPEGDEAARPERR
jgi:membrane-associated phospholipid phosphatase